MSNYTKTVDFAAKDALATGNAAKEIKGTEIDTEFNNIATAVATKADSAATTYTNITFAGTCVFAANATLGDADSGNPGTIDGGTY